MPRLKTSRAGVLLWLTASVLAGPAAPAADPLEITTSLPAPPSSRPSPGAADYRVTAFEIKGRWSSAIALPLKPGDLWTPEKQSAVLEAIQGAYDSDTAMSYLMSQASMASVLYIDVAEEKDEAARTVRLTFRPWRLQLSLAKIGDNLLPIPRSPSPTHYESVPKPLLALQPVFGLSHDRVLGTVFSAGFQNDLLRLPALRDGRLSAPAGPDHLDARFTGAKSTENYHAVNTALTYTRRRLGAPLEMLGAGVGYDGVKEPLAGQTHTANSGRADGTITFKLASRTRLTCDLGYSLANDDLAGAAPSQHTTTRVESNRAVLETQLPAPLGGFLRAALWEDNGWSGQGLGSHQRLAGRAGYAREIAISPNQTIGLELVAGGGRLWGDAPASRRFFGGNSSTQFLYDGVTTPGLRNLPAGPLLRSLGQGAAAGATGPAGGDGYWQVNANLSLPLRSWSLPLIPAEDEVRSMLRNGINVTGRSFLITTLKTQGMSREEARAEADRILGEIRPATEYLIDEANLYALKPLLMFDAGGLTGAAGRSSWTAVGGGLQLNVVTARLELGYMRTLSGPTNGHAGNLFLRLVFQNLF